MKELEAVIHIDIHPGIESEIINHDGETLLKDREFHVRTMTSEDLNFYLYRY